MWVVPKKLISCLALPGVSVVGSAISTLNIVDVGALALLLWLSQAMS
jgi:hypothetical protein